MMVPFGVATVTRIYMPFAVGRQVTARTLFTTDVVIRGLSLRGSLFLCNRLTRKREGPQIIRYLINLGYALVHPLLDLAAQYSPVGGTGYGKRRMTR